MPGNSRRSINTAKMYCGQCKLLIKEETDDFIECDKCAKKYHSQCTKLDKRQFQHLLDNESEMFACQFCDGREDELKAELVDIKTKLAKLDQLSGIQESIQFMSKQYDEILKGVSQNKTKLVELEKENIKLKSEIKGLKNSVKLLNDARAKNDCILTGLKVQEGATAVETIINISKEVGVEMQPENIDDAFFVRNNRPNDQKKTVIVKFSNKSAKQKIMSAKPKLRENPETSSVFVNDLLSKESLNLFNYAKTLKKVGYRHVFARNGVVYYKRCDISRPQIIRCEADVDKLLLDAITLRGNRRKSGATSQTVSDDEDDPFASPN